MTKFLWFIPAVAATLVAMQLDNGDKSPLLILTPLALLWWLALARGLPDAVRWLFAAPVVALRRLPSVLWLVLLASFVALCWVWVITYQPAVGLPLTTPEMLWWAGGVALLFLATVNLTRAEASTIGQRMGWQANILIVLTTLVMLVIGAELALRYFWVASDSFALSKMHQNWNRLYWQPINSYGFRDNEPDANPDKQHVLVIGDSFVSGYGVNSIANTFPHLLGAALGDEYAVNIAAIPGWGVSSALGSAETYPTQPDIVILSIYLNDIVEGEASNAYSAPFPGLRRDPDPQAAWWVDNLYLVNFYYYRIHHYFNLNTGQGYLDWILNAYRDTNVWTAFEGEFQKVIDWTQANDIQLAVVVFPNLADPASTLEQTTAIAGYFTAHDIPTLHLPDVVGAEPAAKLVVNPFDSHPSEFTHQVVADKLYALLKDAAIIP